MASLVVIRSICQHCKKCCLHWEQGGRLIRCLDRTITRLIFVAAPFFAASGCYSLSLSLSWILWRNLGDATNPAPMKELQIGLQELQ